MQLNPISTENQKKKAQHTRKLLAQIKSYARATAPVTLWLAYRYPTPKKADGTDAGTTLYHRVRRLDIDPHLTDKLRNIVNRAIERAKHLEEYTFEGAVEEDSALYEDVSATEFAALRTLIENAQPEDVVEKELHLNRAYAYVVALEPSGSSPIYAFRKLSTTWKAKQLKGLINALLQNKVLVSFEDENVFRFHARIDFFSCAETVFVLEKSNFESALHFRSGMERKRDTLLASLETTGLYTGLSALHALSTTHVRWLKKLAGAYSHGKCIDPNWIEALVDCCTKRGWDVRRVNGKLEITPQNCERVLRLMNYDLLESPIDLVLFEIDGAKRLAN